MHKRIPQISQCALEAGNTRAEFTTEQLKLLSQIETVDIHTRDLKTVFSLQTFER